MLRHTFSPIRIFSGFAAIGVGVLIYMTLNPKLEVEPVPSTDPAAPFGSLFGLHNRSVAVLYQLSSAYCINNFHAPENDQPAAGAVRLGVLSQTVTLPDLSRGETAILPVENAFLGVPGSEVDLVLVVKFQPGWWIDLVERRFRFKGTEGQDKTWTWKPLPPGGPCG